MSKGEYVYEEIESGGSRHLLVAMTGYIIKKHLKGRSARCSLLPLAGDR